MSAFCKDPDGELFHTYSCYARGLDVINGANHWLDLMPKGAMRKGSLLPNPGCAITIATTAIIAAQANMGAVHKVESQMMQVLEHLLKLQHAGGTVRRNNARGWQLSVKDAQLVLRKLLAQNPSLRPQLEEMLEFILPEGRVAGLAQSEAV
jgi:hypothetical protein